MNMEFVVTMIARKASMAVGLGLSSNSLARALQRLRLLYVFSLEGKRVGIFSSLVLLLPGKSPMLDNHSL